MDDASIRMRIRALAGEMAPEPYASVAPSDRLVEDLGYDSLFIMTLLSAIYDEFDLDLPDFEDFEHLESVETVSHLENVIVRRISVTPATGNGGI